MSDRLIDAIRRETMVAESVHGKLTQDVFRAFTILGEEVGEVAEALLILRRTIEKENSSFVGVDGDSRLSSAGERISYAQSTKRYEAIHELVQVMSLCQLMVENLDTEKRYS